MWDARDTPRPSDMSPRTERSDVAALLRTEHAVARVLASAPDEDDAHPRLLAAIGAALGWDFGALWTPVDANGSFTLRWDGPVGKFTAWDTKIGRLPFVKEGFTCGSTP